MGNDQGYKSFILVVKDKNRTDKEPIATILVERIERLYRHEDQSLFEAKLTLKYRVIQNGIVAKNWNGCFKGTYKQYLNSASLINGSLFLDLPGLEGQRIGTYLMSQIVQWLQQWPDASVNSISLTTNQAYPKNKDRRNRFYERYGIEFDYEDDEKKSGLSRPMLVKDLVNVDTWERNIEIREIVDALAEIDDIREELKSRETHIKNLKRQLQDINDSPLLWAFRVLFYRHVGKISLAFVVLFLVIAAYLSA